MKRIYFFLLTQLCVVVCFAQTSLLATLSHGDSITTYYGVQALVEAYNASQTGDVITLSPGNFVSTNIEKAITIRGAGMALDTVTLAEPTIISGNFQINIKDNGTSHFIMEGIYSNDQIGYSNLEKACFVKCRLGGINGSLGSQYIKNTTFIHCRIAKSLYLNANSSVSCIGSIIQTPESYAKTSNFEFQNCVVNLTNSKCPIASSFKNCIVRTDSTVKSIVNSCTMYGCVGIGSASLFYNSRNSTNTIITNYADLFQTYTGGSFENLDDENFKLTEAAAKKYLGTDGTQVGIYGSSFPFDPTPTNPQITKCDVATKSTADGKLSVDIQVNAAE